MDRFMSKQGKQLTIESPSPGQIPGFQSHLIPSVQLKDNYLVIGRDEEEE